MPNNAVSTHPLCHPLVTVGTEGADQMWPRYYILPGLSVPVYLARCAVPYYAERLEDNDSEHWTVHAERGGQAILHRPRSLHGHGGPGPAQRAPVRIDLLPPPPVSSRIMPDFSIPEYRVSVDLLRPVVFIRLERMNWFKHPFLFNSFKITDEEQIRVLKGLGITEVICVPEQSDRLPGRPRPKSAKPGPEEAAPEPEPAPQPNPEAAREIDRLWEIKRERTRTVLED